ncbi:MAG TPA: glycosyltransferase [Actinomycetes bacterium]|nr:glycosyltransferase [Actinomycetes bacterium]
MGDPTVPARELVPAGSRPLRVALIAQPTQATARYSLGGLDHVRRLAVALVQRGHLVTLIGAGLEGLTGVGYAVVDTDPIGDQRASAELVERRHAEQAGKVLEFLGGMNDVEVVSDHTHIGWRPAGGVSEHLPTVHTSYQPLTSPPGPARRRPGHLGWVAISQHQQHRAPSPAWAGMIHPGIPVGEHRLSVEHAGPCVYMGPLLKQHGAGLALEAAHDAGRPIVLAGTTSSGEATAYLEVELSPRLDRGDDLLAEVSPMERWDLLARASCLVAPLAPHVPYSLEIVEAMAYGTPVVTLAGTVGAELVNHGPGGLIVNHAGALARAIEGTERLDPRRARHWASVHFDLPVMAVAYERLLSQLLGTESR